MERALKEQPDSQEVRYRGKCRPVAHEGIRGMFYRAERDLFLPAMRTKDGWRWEDGTPARIWTCERTKKLYCVECLCCFEGRLCVRLDDEKMAHIVDLAESLVGPRDECALPMETPPGWKHERL